jgi:lysozyme family protein
MNFDRHRRPAFGSTDWAAQQFRRILDEEERRRAGGRRAIANDDLAQVAQAAEPAPATDGLSAADLWRLPDRQWPDYLRNLPGSQDGRRPPDYNPLPPEVRNSFGTEALDAIELTRENRRAMIRRMIAEFEGGFVDDPDDRGGPTRYGMTDKGIGGLYELLAQGPKAAGAAMRKGITPRDITPQEAVDAYDIIMRGSKIDLIADPALREQLFDMAVNLGPVPAGRLFLATLAEHGYETRNGPTDGVIGSQALSAIRDLARAGNSQVLANINNDLAGKRRAHYEALIAADASQDDYRRGWLKRAGAFRIRPTGDQR